MADAKQSRGDLRLPVSSARRRKLEPMLWQAKALKTPAVASGSGGGSRLGSAAAEMEEDTETRLAALEAQHGIETPQPSRGPSRANSCPGSRISTGRPVSNAAQSAARSMLGTPLRPASHSQSAPVLELAPSLPVISEIRVDGLTRQVQYKRSPTGGFVTDAPAWCTDSNPVLPSRHRYLSSALWGSVNPVYKLYEEESNYRGDHVDHKILGPPVRAFMNPRDKNTIFNEETFKFGNQQIMRKGGGPCPCNGHGARCLKKSD